jgi:hypothetical protein
VLPPGVVSPEIIGLPATSRTAPSDAISPDRQEQIARTRDGWLDWIRAHPSAYLKEYERYSAGERPNWIRSLAQRAAERGDLDEVVTALRATGEPLGPEVAGAFEAAARGEEGSALP